MNKVIIRVSSAKMAEYKVTAMKMAAKWFADKLHNPKYENMTTKAMMNFQKGIVGELIWSEFYGETLNKPLGKFNRVDSKTTYGDVDVKTTDRVINGVASFSFHKNIRGKEGKFVSFIVLGGDTVTIYNKIPLADIIENLNSNNSSKSVLVSISTSTLDKMIEIHNKNKTILQRWFGHA